MRSLNADADAGSIEGYAVRSSAEQIPNWLSEHTLQEETGILCEAIKSLCGEVAILKSLRVDEDSRGQGVGGSLLDEAINESYADVILLVADTFEIQAEGFDLRSWYEGRDFEVVVETGAGPLMAWPPDMAQALRSALDHGPRGPGAGS